MVSHLPNESVKSSPESSKWVRT